METLEFRTPGVLRGLFGFGCLFALALLTGSVVLYLQGEPGVALVSGAVWLLALPLFGYLALRANQTVTLAAAHLQVTGWLSARQIAFGDITRLRWRWGHLIVESSQAPLSLYFPIPNQLAQLETAIEQRAPLLLAARRQVQQGSFPLHINTRLSAPLLTILVGTILFGVGVAVLAYSLLDPSAAGSRFDRLAQFLTAGLMLLFGALFVLRNLLGLIWRYTFTADEISLRYTFWTRRYDPAHLQRLELVRRTEYVRGVPWDVFSLKCHFSDGRLLAVEPNAQNFPIDYVPERERRMLADLHAQLSQHYRLKK